MKAEHDDESSKEGTPCQQKSFLIRDGSLESLVAKHLRFHLETKSFGELAEKLGISKGMLARYAKAEQSMTLGTLQKIQLALGVSLEEMLGKDAVRNPRNTAAEQPQETRQ